MRKQVYDLTAEDLSAHPVWEFALDEEARPGQDEATVRPYASGGEPAPAGGMFVVRSAFTLANGVPHVGYVYYTPELPAGIGHAYGPLSNRQPVITTARGQVMFWYGRLVPSAQHLADAYDRLESAATDVFPIRYITDVGLSGGPLDGEIGGFSYLVERRKGWFSSETVVEVVS